MWPTQLFSLFFTRQDLPWYTWVAAGALALLATGVVWALALLSMHAVLALFLAAWGVLCAGLRRLTGWGVPRSHGTAHWAGKADLRRAGVFGEDGLPLGTWRGRPLRLPQGHLLLCGPPRSSKSWGALMPMLRSFPGSILAIDMRGELYDETWEGRERYGPVYRFAPTETVSCDLNLLDAIRWDSPFQFGDLHRLVRHLLAPSGDATTDTFRAAATPLLLAILVARHQAYEGNFPAVVAWMTDPGRTLVAKAQELLAHTDPLVTTGGRRFLDLSERMRSATWSAVLEPLTPFMDPLVAAHTAKSAFDLTSFQYGVEPCTLYLALGFHEVSRLGTLLGAFVEVLTGLISSPAPTLPRHRVLLLLDEMMNLGRLEELERGVSYLAGAGCQVVAVAQNLQQLVATYGEHTPLAAAIGCQVHYTPVDTRTAQAISTHLGEATVTSMTVSSGTQSGVSEGEHMRPLLTVGEVLRFPQDQAIILLQGTAPIRCTKAGIPPPASRPTRLLASVARHPWAYGALGVCLGLALALWPLLRSGNRHVTPVSTPPPQSDTPTDTPARSLWTPPPSGVEISTPVTVESPTKVETPGRWAMTSLTTGNRGELLEVERGRFPTQAACSAGLASQRWQLNRTRESGQWTVDMVEDDATHVAWQQSMPGVKPMRQGAWCREQTK